MGYSAGCSFPQGSFQCKSSVLQNRRREGGDLSKLFSFLCLLRFSDIFVSHHRVSGVPRQSGQPLGGLGTSGLLLKVLLLKSTVREFMGSRHGTSGTVWEDWVKSRDSE